MQSIIVKYLLATDTKGDRLKVSTSFGKAHRIVGRDYGCSITEQENIIAKDMAIDLGWSGTFARSVIQDETIFVNVADVAFTIKER